MVVVVGGNREEEDKKKGERHSSGDIIFSVESALFQLPHLPGCSDPREPLMSLESNV